MTGLARSLLVVFVGMLVGVVAWGVDLTARRAGLAPSSRRRLVLVTGAGLVGWLGGVALVAHAGLLQVWTARPPRLFLVPLAALALLMVLTRTTTFRALLSAAPSWWPIALQSFRVGVELLLFALFLEGLVPEQMTFEGRNFDVLIGLSAPFMALLVASSRVGPRAVLAWNVVGLLMLANVVGTALTSVPGPLHLAWPGAPLTEIARWPMVWIPGFLVPLAVFLHVASLRQTFATRGEGAGQPGATS